jgi:hypothetical protein
MEINAPKENKMHKLMATSIFIIIFLLSSFAAAVESPQPEIVDKPLYKVNDSWTFLINDRSQNGDTKERHWILSIVRSSADSVLQSAKPIDSSMPPLEKLLGTDLSLAVSINGQEAIVHKPFDFPMKIGKKWKVAYENESNTKKVKKHRIDLQYTVVGWEEVSVLAGKFLAFKVEAEGTWRDEFNPTPLSTNSVSQIDKGGAQIVVKNQNPTVPDPIMGRIFRTYWYVPAVKREVKSIEEQFKSDGTLSSKSTWELEAYTLAGQGNNK